jgi:hypothetical protein
MDVGWMLECWDGCLGVGMDGWIKIDAFCDGICLSDEERVSIHKSLFLQYK